MNVKEMMARLSSEKVKTWFDLGLFLDRVRDNRQTPTAMYNGTFDGYQKSLNKGVAFLTFNTSIDGVTMEIVKYIKAIRNLQPKVKIHYISGEFQEKARTLIPKGIQTKEIPQLKPFNEWLPYKDFFETKLQRGSKEYNKLITELWTEALTIAEELGKYIQSKSIKLVYTVNTNSNPGQCALALALVLVSEYMKIPVISNNHDFYWEGGNSEVDREVHNIPDGPRDHFFRNAHLGEVQALLDMVYPWQSRHWLSVNINRTQSKTLISRFGHNPANVTEIGTAVDTDEFTRQSPRRRRESLKNIGRIFSDYQNELKTVSIGDYINALDTGGCASKPVLLGESEITINKFADNNFVLLQPTRIIKRKLIETNFQLMEQLFHCQDFEDFFHTNPQLKLTLIVTGPIAVGHSDYLKTLCEKFEEMIARLPEEYHERVYLGFLFSAFDHEECMKKLGKPLTIADIYNAASLVLLPSETEGRGLPIIEAAACGVPILTRRYQPERVFEEVIGEKLSREYRLQVIEFSGTSINDATLKKARNYLLYPHDYAEIAEENRLIIENRYSLKTLEDNISEILFQLYLQLKPNDEAMGVAVEALTTFQQRVNRHKKELAELIDQENRQYLPGYAKMGFMIYLKSLIDPSSFRHEEQHLRGRAMKFARSLIKADLDPVPFPQEKLAAYYNAVESLFLYHQGEVTIRHDHSMAYRHRSKRFHPFYDLTPQELTGVINMIFNETFNPPPPAMTGHYAPQNLTDWPLMVAQICQSTKLGIDDRKKLRERYNANVPIAYFPDGAIKQELETFILHPIRERLGLNPDEELFDRHLREAQLAPIYIFKQIDNIGSEATIDSLKVFISTSKCDELKRLFKHGFCKLIATKHKSVGLDFRQLGRKALNKLIDIKNAGGFMITVGEDAAVMTDIVGMERFHIGKVTDPLSANLMGLKVNEGFVQWLPADIRFCLTYPTPIQTGRDLDKVLKSEKFQQLCDKIGYDLVLKEICKEAREQGTPIAEVVDQLALSDVQEPVVDYSSVNGVYSDGHPWSGALAHVHGKKAPMIFESVASSNGTKTVTEFCRIFTEETDRKVQIAWNGGYILNPELVGKLHLPESYIGSPLGLIIADGKVKCPPLFNKPAFIVYTNGQLAIKRVSSENGLSVKADGHEITFTRENYNLEVPGNDPVFYDLMHPKEEISGNGRVIVRIAGNVIKEIVRTEDGENVKIIPVGLTFSLHPSQLPATWQVDTELDITMLEWPEIGHAIEAGPMLLQDGKDAINMKVEGWKTDNSIRTQAARLDYLDMRGPKIAIGLDAKGNLAVLTVNGRIRESVGATHCDMRDILKSYDMEFAMGFDPGGSSTLVVDDRPLNISPYNKDYERNIYSMSPQPRAVANAVLGFINEK